MFMLIVWRPLWLTRHIVWRNGKQPSTIIIFQVGKYNCFIGVRVLGLSWIELVKPITNRCECNGCYSNSNKNHTSLCQQDNRAEITLCNHSPYVITRSPSKKNLFYSVGVFKGVEETFRPLAQKLKSVRVDYPKTIINYPRRAWAATGIVVCQSVCLFVWYFQSAHHSLSFSKRENTQY